MEVRYSHNVAKKIRKHQLPKEIWVDFRDAFEALAKSRNLRLFDIKRLVAKGPYVYFRLRVRNYRALFHMDDTFIYVEEIGPRGEIYKRWR
jgi:mRNA-degrading endonuclease RelE of RelBE toxin-antitoxin system